MLLTMHSGLSFLSILQIPISILSHSTLTLFLLQNSIMIFTTKNSSQSLRHSRFGDTTWRAYTFQQMSLLTTITYFFTIKILTYYQARWSKYLSQFNLIVYFYLGYLRAKPDTFTRYLDVYLKGEEQWLRRCKPAQFQTHIYPRLAFCITLCYYYIIFSCSSLCIPF